MSKISVFDDNNPSQALQESETPQEIARLLNGIGSQFEQWEAGEDIQAGDQQDKVIAAYQKDINRLVAEKGYQTVDVVSLTPDFPDKENFRKKFLSEHTHNEDEVRFFVDGHGLFTLHVDNKIYEVLCTKGDLISVPANTPHWFDMGPNPHFACIRLFNNTEGWVAHFTGSPIADQFTRLNN